MAPITPPTTFLSLAPTTSASYPSTPISRSPVLSPTTEPTQTLEDELVAEKKQANSEGSGKRRFLKLGPVFYTIGNVEGETDWSD